jgi:hypothetical protein
MRSIVLASFLCTAGPALAGTGPDLVSTTVAQADGDPLATPAPPPAAMATTAAAPAATAPVAVVRPAPKIKDPFFTYASFGFNAYTYLGATATAPSTQLDPSKRAIIYQQVGAAYYFHKYLRAQLTFIFGETVTNAPAGTNTFSSLAIVPMLVFSTHGFFTGAGPSLAPISYGKAPNFDAGIYTATGYSVKLGKGFSLPLAVQLVIMLDQRTSVALTPSVALAYRF